MSRIFFWRFLCIDHMYNDKIACDSLIDVVSPGSLVT